MAAPVRQRANPVSNAGKDTKAAKKPAQPAKPKGRPAPDFGAFAARDKQMDDANGLGPFAILRMLERRAGDKPRIGQNQRLRDALARLGQDPFLAFPDKDIARADMNRAQPMLRAQFLGFFGAFGAMPLNWTEEVRRWFDDGDESFVAFTDIFASRFQELFFRAWSDSRAITQFDHKDDRFQAYLLSLIGTGTPAYRNREALPDTARMRLAPLAQGRVKSPVRLQQMLQVHFGDRAIFSVEEMVATWLDFEPDSLSRLGLQGATLGQNVHLGARVRSIGEKFRLHVHVPDFETYRRFLLGGLDYATMRDVVFWYVGQAYEIEVALWLPEPQVQPAQLGSPATQLGWMACLAPDPGNPDHQKHAATFALEPNKDNLNETLQKAA